MRIRGLDHIVLNVSDVERSVNFYSNVLGLETVRLDDWRAGKVPFPSVRVSEATIIDIFPAKQPVSGQNLDHFCLVLDCDDMQQLVGEITAAGVSIDGGPSVLFGARGSGAGVYVRDPDDNRLELRTYSQAAMDALKQAPPAKPGATPT